MRDCRDHAALMITTDSPQESHQAVAKIFDGLAIGPEHVGIVGPIAELGNLSLRLALAGMPIL
jgi:hypothetical protein